MKRTTNIPLLKQWIFENAPLGTEKLCLEAGVSFSLLEKMINGRYSAPKDALCKRIANVLNVPIDEAFPKELPRNKE